MFLVNKDFVKKNMALRPQFQMLILALHQALHSSTPDFNLAQVLVQDLLSQSLLKVTTFLEDARR